MKDSTRFALAMARERMLAGEIGPDEYVREIVRITEEERP
jgi:uncharacterized membrane protein